jgi:NAD(P)-dependent dehydrogenase (short-subunit alcohol dehydrogenase family)
VNDTEPVLAGKIVLYTGAGRGIGRAGAGYAAALGATVLVNDIDAEVAEQAAVEISAASGTAVAMPGDISDWDAVDAMVTGIVDRFGRLDGLVNNAALFRMAPMDETSPELWDSMLRANVLGVAACGQRAARQMLAQGSGSIVNVTSGSQCGLHSMSVYGATKAAVASLTYTWSIELAASGVRVNALSPRGDSRMSQYGGEYIASHTTGPQVVEPPPEVNAPAVAFLLSDFSAGITGQILRVDGPAMGLMTHPAVAVPMVVNPEWDVASLSAAFDADFRNRQQPCGVAGLRVSEVLGYGEPGWSVPVQDLVPRG